MKTIIIIGLIIFCIYLISLLVRHIRSIKKLKKCFSKNNVIVYGKKGSGKDLLFQAVINARHEDYYSNISYGGKYHKCKVSDLNLGSNTYESFINGNVEILKKKTLPFEKKDFYLSDCGIILPSQYDSMLHKQFKGFPISYALSRHLWNNNIHCNTQSLDRVWKALREQADTYIRVQHTVKSFFPGMLKIYFTIYDKYESARANKTMLGSRVWNKYSKAQKDLYIAENGLIEERFLYISKKKIYYDTRAYHKILFGRKYSKKKK